MKTAMQIASGIFLAEQLPDNWREMSESELFNTIEETLWEPFEMSDPAAVWEWIENAAFSIEDYKPDMEVFYEVVAIIERERAREERLALIDEIDETQGTGGFYELAEEITREFEKAAAAREWAGDFFEEIEKFVGKRLNP